MTDPQEHRHPSDRLIYAIAGFFVTVALCLFAYGALTN